MRFEVISALVVGVLLPILETVRRGIGHWGVEFTTMFEDYVAGAVLLVAGLAATRAKPFAPLLLVTAWAYVTGMMSSSFWDQIESTVRGVDLEPHNSSVLVFKLLLWSTCLTSLVLALRHASTQARQHGA